MNLNDIKTRSRDLSTRAYLATIRADSTPDVVPVHPGWERDTLWIMTGRDSVKARNVARNPRVALHWEVNEAGDGLEVWGTAVIHHDATTKRRLWTGIFDYDLDSFSSGGVDHSPEIVFISVRPERAVYARAFGTTGVDRWRAPGVTG